MLIRKLEFENLLSFGKMELELQPLNVCIGPNGSGKSNLIAAMGLLRSCAGDLNSEIVRGGGARAWIRAGQDLARFGFRFNLPLDPFYYLRFGDQSGGLSIHSESDLLGFLRDGSSVTVFGRPEVQDIAVNATALSQLRGLSGPPATRGLGDRLSKIEIHYGFDTSPRSQTRTGSPSGLEKDRLLDGGYNLANVLDQLQFVDVLPRINEGLRRLCDQFLEVKTRDEGGLRQVYLKEAGGTFAATRLSDGTLKFLCLMAILHNPSPPPLICIDEPETGLHPDALRIVAEALIDASTRTQLIVTTHSETLVDGLSGKPETVVVCERGEAGTSEFKRLEPERLASWLENYSLGEIWRSGEIGGNRW